MKKEVFLEKVLAVHGDKYDYSLVPDEFPQKDKVTIICPKHGEFSMTVGNLIWNKRGCAKCGFEHVAGIKREKARQHFYAMAPILHNFKYDYALSEYTSSDDKVKIICPIHGMFEQTPAVHMTGCGCQKCGREVTKLKQAYDEETFINVAMETHGDRFDYSELNFKSMKHKVNIICRIHGKFEQAAINHLHGNGCPECSKEGLREKFKMPEKEFLDRVYSNFPDYDLSKCVYINAHTRVTVTCPAHGEFQQLPRHLVLGHGCRSCGYGKNAIARSKDVSNYIGQFNGVHNNFYDYSKASNTNSKEKFIVICPIHGEFLTTTSNHIKGKGCPKCGQYKSGFRSNKAGTFYILRVTEDVYKFGISNKFEQRLKQIQLKSVFDIQCLLRYDFDDGHIARVIESEIIASDIQRGVINHCDMRCGYSETFYSKDLSKVLDIVNKHKPA